MFLLFILPIVEYGDASYASFSKADFDRHVKGQAIGNFILNLVG